MTAEVSAVTRLNPAGRSPFVLTCEHASNFIPARYQGLGLPAAELKRHIAWDIGAAQVARQVSQLLDAPLFLAGFSRLLIDCNRPLTSPTSIPLVSEVTTIPGNHNLDARERQWRIDHCFRPFQEAIADHLQERARQGRAAIIIGVHSFTPVFKGQRRPWAAGVLFRRAQAFGQALVEALRQAGDEVAANQPYQIEDDSDYTVPVQGEARGLDAVLIEIRQDLISAPSAVTAWAERLQRALAKLGG